MTLSIKQGIAISILAVAVLFAFAPKAHAKIGDIYGSLTSGLCTFFGTCNQTTDTSNTSTTPSPTPSENTSFSGTNVIWNTAQVVNLCNASGEHNYACASRLLNPNITINYHVQITDDLGNVVAQGATIPAGTTLHLSFVPHVYTDVYWFGTGFSFDSPYGEWRADAIGPTPIAADAKDYISTIYTGAGGSGDTPLAAYRPLVVNPPIKSIGGVDGFNCDAPESDGSLTCTPTQSGTYTPQFEFADTYGHFYWRFTNMNNGITVGDNIPMITFTGPNPSQIPYYGPSGYDYHSEGIVLGNTYTLNIPAQSVPFPITVTGGNGGPPTPPTLSPLGQCTLGQPHTITMVSTDPDNDNIHYGVDWDSDGR